MPIQVKKVRREEKNCLTCAAKATCEIFRNVKRPDLHSCMFWKDVFTGTDGEKIRG